jgi:hypothetical protein
VSRFFRTAVSMVIGLCAAACGDVTGLDNGAAPLVVHITTPFPDDGAVLVALYGTLPVTVNVVAGSAERAVYSVRVADTLRIAVFGVITSGPLVRLDVSSAAVVSQIYGQVEGAASLGHRERGAVSGYTLRLEQGT